MNRSQFEIYGKERKKLKKKLFLLKCERKSFWHHFCIDKDMRMVYGDYEGCLSENEAREHCKNISEKIKHLQYKLNKKYKEYTIKEGL